MNARNEVLRTLIAASEEKVSHYARLLADEEARLAQLQTELRAFCYPIHTLPLEIILEILIHCMPTDHERVLYRLSTTPTPWVRIAPRLLTHVCGRWRHIVLSTPQFWSQLHIELSFRVGESELADHLERSAGIPLNVTISGGLRTELVENDDEEETQEFLLLPSFLSRHSRMFARYCNRIRDLKLSLDSQTAVAFDAEVCGFSSPFPHFAVLETVVFEDGLQTATAPLQMLRFTPRLVEVAGFDINAATIQLPWAQLTQYRGQLGPTAVASARLLDLMVNLRMASLNTDENLLDELPASPITHPTLEILHIKGWNPPAVLQFLAAPALQSLSVESSNGETTHTMLGRFLRQTPSLVSFRLHVQLFYSPGVSNFLGGLFENTPGLQEFHLNPPIHAIFDELCEALSGPYLPHLAKLTITSVNQTDSRLFADIIRQIVSTIRRRQSLIPSVALLRSLKVCVGLRGIDQTFFFTPPKIDDRFMSLALDDRDLAFLQELQAGGLLVDIGLAVSSFREIKLRL
uniref:F-box domain-containing protein n=1 Tax=Mycena chlorophos TaxID=658473 RepID=A0ABQ0M612_MYCCL|nr:predicted protein [Mycena chlorophos]